MQSTFAAFRLAGTISCHWATAAPPHHPLLIRPRVKHAAVYFSLAARGIMRSTKRAIRWLWMRRHLRSGYLPPLVPIHVVYYLCYRAPFPVCASAVLLSIRARAKHVLCSSLSLAPVSYGSEERLARAVDEAQLRSQWISFAPRACIHPLHYLESFPVSVV